MKTTSKLVLLGGAVIRGLHETNSGSPHNRHRSGKGGLNTKFAMLMLSLMLSLTGSAATCTMYTKVYVDGVEEAHPGCLETSLQPVIAGSPMFCSALTPIGMTVVGWSFLEDDGTLTRIPYSEGQNSTVFMTPTGKKSFTVVVEFTRVKPKEPEKKKNGLMLILR